MKGQLQGPKPHAINEGLGESDSVTLSHESEKRESEERDSEKRDCDIAIQCPTES